MNKMSLTAITAILIYSTAYANEIAGTSLIPPNNGLIENSYLVTFREPIGTEQPLIWPGDRTANLIGDPVPFGEHSTGQSKTELANTLGINGQVVRIFESINAAQISMDSEEAYKLSLDERVLHIEQDRIVSSMDTQANPDDIAKVALSNNLSNATFFATDNSIYNEELLIIPSVDTPDQVGKYLDVTFKPTGEGTWELLDFKETNKDGGGVSVAPIETVELITTDSFPKQVFLKVETINGANCAQLQAIQRLDGNQINVGINLIPLPVGWTCTASVDGTLIKTIPLSVYGLKAGTYTYNVNNNGAYSGVSGIGLTGTFNLDVDNGLAGDTSL